MHRRSVAALCLLLTTAIARAGIADDPSKARAIDKLIEEIGNGKNPGVALVVVEPGKPPFVRCKGMAEIEKNAPITVDTRFYVASMAKQFTAACVLLAERDGKLARTDRASKFFPALEHSQATIADLLDHRSGIPDLYEVLAIAGSEGDPLESNAAGLLVAEKLAKTSEPPGRRFSYSNTAYLVLTKIVSDATGSSFAEYAQKSLFAPAGMTRSLFRDHRDLAIEGRAFGYQTSSGRPLRQDEDEEVGFCGPGGLFTSITDLMRWDEVNRSGKPFGSDFVATQTTVRNAPNGFRTDPRFPPYALGLMVGEFRGHRVVRHAGGTGAFSSELMRFADPPLSVICLSNDGAVGASGIAESAAAIWFGSKDEAAPPTKAKLDSKVPRGFYADTKRAEVWLLGERGNDLVLATTGVSTPMAVDAKGGLEGLHTASPIAAHVDADGALHVTLGKQTLDLSFVAAAPKPVAEDCDVTGAYRHAALETLVDLSVDHGKLILLPRSDDSKPIPLLALDHDCYVNDRVVLTFERDGAGKPIGFTANTDRARLQKFVRVP